MRRLWSLALVLGFLGTSPLAADGVTLASRLQRLDASPQPLRGEVEWLREQPIRPPAGEEAVSVGWTAEETRQMDSYTLEQIQQMMAATAKNCAWRKGDFTIIPYGFLWGSTVYETERSRVGDYALYIYSADTHGQDAYHVDARSTRIGFDVAGPRLRLFNCAKSGGKVEFDFQGNFVTENKPGVLLRHAYWEVKNDDFRLLMGQTWDIIAPLNPGTIMYSVYWGAGNIGYRRAQIRYERYLKFSPYSMITLQGSLNDDIVSDFTSPNDDIEGDRSGWPVIEGRAAWTLGHRGKGCRPVVVGVSGHIGEQEFDFGPTTPNPGEFIRRTYSLNADFRVPITHCLGVHGEFFTGENLGAYLGGVLQGVNPVTTLPIRSTGGWVGLWYDWSSCWHSNVAFTIDDPFNQDIAGMTHGRTYNSAYFLNLIYDVTKQFKMGFEVSSWKTLYNDQRPGESVRFEYMAKYGF